MNQGNELLEHQGFEIMEHVDWVKRDDDGNLCRSKGVFFQHSKQTFLIAHKVDGIGSATHSWAIQTFLFAARGRMALSKSQ